MKNLITITAILALASSTTVNAKKDRHTNRLHKKNQRKLEERNLRRGQIEQIDNLTKKRINQRMNNNNKTRKKNNNNDIDGLEEDVTFWTNMVRKTQMISLPDGPVDPDFGVDPPVDPDFGVDPPVDPDFGVDPPVDPDFGIPSPTPPLPPPTTGGGDVVASVCAAGETCIEVGEICSDGTTEECCGETFDSFTCECGSNLVYGSCGATNACLDIVCEGDGTGVDEDGTGGDVPPPAEGFICPDVSLYLFPIHLQLYT